MDKRTMSVPVAQLPLCFPLPLLGGCFVPLAKWKHSWGHQNAVASLDIALSPNGCKCGFSLKAQGRAWCLSLGSHSGCVWDACGIKESRIQHPLRQAAGERQNTWTLI